MLNLTSFEIDEYQASDIFYYKTVDPISQKAPFRNIEVKSKKLVAKATGIYFIFFEDRLLYLGIFSNAKSGAVDQVRWLKHIETFSMRGKNVTLAEGSQDFLGKRGHQQFLIDCESFKKPKGRVSSKMRGDFAGRNWHELETVEPQKLLNKFSFLFQKISRQKDQSGFHFKKYLQEIESSYISSLKPIGNKLFPDSSEITKDQLKIFLNKDEELAA